MSPSSFIDRINDEDVVVFVGAHPDDETTVGPLLAWCADRAAELVVVSLTRGDSGWNLGPEDTTRTLTEVRSEEFRLAVGHLGGTPVLMGYVNGTSRAHPEGLAVHESAEAAAERWGLDGARDREPQTILTHWTGANGDPADRLRELLLARGATVVITLDAEQGFTGHPEHIATAMAVRRAVRVGPRRDGSAFALYYAWKPSDARAPAGERIAAGTLAHRGDRDHRKVAGEAWGAYVSQFGPAGTKRSEETIQQWFDACLLVPAPTATAD